MAKAKTNALQTALLRVSRVHFFYVAAYIAQLLLYHAWNLITLQAVMWRWIAVAGLFVVVIAVWFAAHSKTRQSSTYKLLIFGLILADIAFASFNIYTQRGMASRAVALYAIPIVVSAIYTSGTALMATAAICAASYIATAVSYFTINFNEGYKIELYGEVGFYCAMFFVLAGLLAAILRLRDPPKL